MAEPSIDIERIVEEVLRALHTLGGAEGCVTIESRLDGGTGATGGLSAGGATGGLSASAAPARPDKLPVAPDGSAASATPTPPSAAANGQLVMTGRVVTLSALDGRWAGIRQLVVPPGAIVTPAVRDELRRRNVALGFAASPANEAPTKTLLLTLVAHAGVGDPAELLAALAGTSVVVRQENLDCLIAACERLAGLVAGGKGLGLLLTRHTPAAICLANRHQGVRAVLAADVMETIAAVKAIGANLLVADPTTLGAGRLKRVVLDYCRVGVRPCPRVLEKELA
jgi:hypothetical protein